MSHTPGPWEAREDYMLAPRFGVTSGDNPICRIVREDDAKLIAAAPDMLAALQMVSEKIDEAEREMLSQGLNPRNEERVEIDMIRAAIAKATA